MTQPTKEVTQDTAQVSVQDSVQDPVNTVSNLEPPSVATIERRLRVVRWVGLSDFVLLIALVSASLLGRRELVSLLGPVHGVNYLFLVMLVSLGAVDKLWRWWFPALTFLTGGPLGSFIGEIIIGRSLKTQKSTKTRGQT